MLYSVCSRTEGFSDKSGSQFNSGSLCASFPLRMSSLLDHLWKGELKVVVKYKVNFRIKSAIFYKVLPLSYYKVKIRYTQWRTQEFCSGWGGSTNSVQDRGQRERGFGGGSPLVRGSGDRCDSVLEISFNMVIF